MLLQKVLRNRFDRLAADPVLFVKAFDREPWPYQADMLRTALARREDGKFENQTVIVSMPRQNGKSTISAWAALWRLFTDENQEIVSVANDQAQASIILNDARRIIRNSSILYDALDDFGLTRSEIRLKDGSRWLVKSSESVSSRGLRPSTIAYDELGWTTDRDLFDVLSAGQAAQSNPLCLITSTVGAYMGGILWDLFELARAKVKGIKLIYHTENLSPLITEEYLERERAMLPAPVYAREHLNQWGEGSDAFCTEADWLRAISDGDPRRELDPGPSYVYVDLGWTHDETAIAVCKRLQSGKVAVLALETFQGSQSHPVEFAAVEDRIVDLFHRFGAQSVVIKSPQGVATQQRLTSLGVSATVLYPTILTNQQHWGALYTALKNGSILLPNDARLRRQLLTLTIQTTATGWRVVDVPSIHQDRAVAIAGALACAIKTASADEWIKALKLDNQPQVQADPFAGLMPRSEGINVWGVPTRYG